MTGGWKTALAESPLCLSENILVCWFRLSAFVTTRSSFFITVIWSIHRWFWEVFLKAVHPTTNLEHEGVHLLLNVLMAHVTAVLICGLQQHVQKCLSFLCAAVRVAVCFNAGNVLFSFAYNLRGNERAGLNVAWTKKMLKKHWFPNYISSITDLVRKGL